MRFAYQAGAAAPFEPLLDNYFLTNPIARSSKVDIFYFFAFCRSVHMFYWLLSSFYLDNGEMFRTTAN